MSYMPLEIADYIIAALVALDDLADVKVFVRGVIPPATLGQELYPYTEVFVSRETQDANMPRLTGNVHGRVYNGLITFSTLSTTVAGGDWNEINDERTIEVPSFDYAVQLAALALAEMGKCEHASLGDLSVTVNDATEVVTQFYPDNGVIYGLDRAARVNNWENFASLEFTVHTHRTITES